MKRSFTYTFTEKRK